MWKKYKFIFISFILVFLLLPLSFFIWGFIGFEYFTNDIYVCHKIQEKGDFPCSFSLIIGGGWHKKSMIIPFLLYTYPHTRNSHSCIIVKFSIPKVWSEGTSHPIIQKRTILDLSTLELILDNGERKNLLPSGENPLRFFFGDHPDANRWRYYRHRKCYETSYIFSKGYQKARFDTDIWPPDTVTLVAEGIVETASGKHPFKQTTKWRIKKERTIRKIRME